jgi:hypothetical protein
MANIIGNMLTISAEELKYLEEFLVETRYSVDYFSYAETVPIPAEIKNNTDEDNDQWYYWNMENWDVKWDATLVSFQFEPKVPWIIIKFESPWNPPRKWLLKTSRKYPHLKFKLEAEYDDSYNLSQYKYICVNGHYVELFEQL